MASRLYNRDPSVRTRYESRRTEFRRGLLRDIIRSANFRAMAASQSNRTISRSKGPAGDMRLFLTTDGQGNRVDRSYAENAIRTEWSVTAPYDYVEPTSRANLTSWIVPRTSPTVYPSVDPNPRRLTSVGFAASDEDALSQLAFSQNASFVATRYGLCRFRRRIYGLAEGDPLVHNDLIPWGASSCYPNPVFEDASNPKAAHTYLRPTQTFPWQFVGSGCLPIFYMDQANPYMKPLPGVIRNQGRFGDTVRSKFRSLELTIEEFPYCGTVESSGAWSAQTTLQERNACGLQVMPERTVDRVRVIIFTRKRERRNPDAGSQPLMPPVYPPAPAGAYRETPNLPMDSTWDTPSHGEHVMRWESSHPDSAFQIVEDVVLEFPPFKPTGQGMYTAAPNITAGTHRADLLFKGYGTANQAANGSGTSVADASARDSMAVADADGLPHTRRKIRFKRTYKDMGHKLRWTKNGSVNTHEGIDTGGLSILPAVVRDANSNPLLSGSAQPPGGTDGTVLDVDMCDRELFITVLTGAYLDIRPITFSETPTTCDERTYSTFANQYGRAWNISPASVCHPALVSVKTKHWYADEPLQGRPDQMRIVDATGADTGNRLVLDRPDPGLPGELPQI